MVNKKAQYVNFDSVLHSTINGQNGLVASISSAVSNTALVISGLTGMTALSVGNILTINNAANSNNNGSFLITSFISATSVRVDNTIGVAPDANNGSIHWIEKLPYALEEERVRTDDIYSIIGTSVPSVAPSLPDHRPFTDDPYTDILDALDILNNAFGSRYYGISYLNDGYTITNTIKQLANNTVGISTHPGLRDLIHFIDEGPANGFTSGAYKEVLPAADPFPTSIIWYKDNTKTSKIVEKILVRDSNQMPATITWNMYDENGTNISHSITDTISYLNNIFESNRVRVIS